MRLLEVRDGLVKLESDVNLELSSFLIIEDNLKSYIAQIIQAFNSKIFYAKLLFLYNDTILDYDKSLPSLDSKLREFNDIKLLMNNYEAKESILMGNFVKNNEPIIIDRNDLNKKTLISIDEIQIINTIISNLKKQLKKIIIIDCIGNLNGKKNRAGVDFKIPLNTEALNFIYEDCLNDATLESKVTIKEIFSDLSEYSKTVPFLPFDTLKTIIDDMVEKQHVFKLLVLKNKLGKFAKLGYFAKSKEEVDKLDEILLASDSVIDLSKLDSVFLNRYLNIILSSVEQICPDAQVIIQVSNFVDKKMLKRVLTGNLSSLFVSHSRFKYLNEIKLMFENFIIEPNFINNENFKPFSKLLSAMPKNTFLIVGEATKRIPLISTVVENSFETEILIEESLDDELEESLNEVIEDELDEQEYSSIVAVENKSNDFIEKLAEEVQNSTEQDEIELFSDEEEIEEAIIKEEDLLDANIAIESSTTEVELKDSLSDMAENNPEELLDEIDDLKDDSIISIDDEEFHTRVNDCKIVETIDGSSETEDSIVDVDDVIEVSDDVLDELSQDVIDENEITLNNEGENLNEIEPQELDVSDYAKEDIKEDIIDERITDEILMESNEDKLEDFENTVEVLDNQDDDFMLAEIVELDESEISDDAIIVDMDDDLENYQEQNKQEDLDKEIVEDVDKVFTTMKEDSISDSDLDFIDELNNNLNEDSILASDYEEIVELEDIEDNELLVPVEEISTLTESDDTDSLEVLETRSSSTPIIPVYNADIPSEDIVSSDPIEQGDLVVHAKYGNGVVEKMIKYGAKTLYSINFDNVGRRLLDPTLTEIKKF